MTDYTKFSDEELIKMYKDGDEKVADFICDKYRPLIYTVVQPLYLVSGQKEDLFQEGQIGLFNAIRSYKVSSEVSFAGFARLCIQRQIYKAIEAGNRKKNEPLNEFVSIYSDDEDGPSEGIYVADTKSDPARIVEEAEYMAYRTKAVRDSLSKLEQQVFDLCLEGYTYREIAIKLDKPDKSIDNCLQRIHQKARKLS